MKKTEIGTFAMFGALLFMTPLSAVDLSEYRGFDLNGGLAAIAERASAQQGETKVLHERPSLIRELRWRSEPGDSIDQIVFSFIDADLYRMVVSYDRAKVEGLTEGDMVDAFSREFGLAKTTDAEIQLQSIYDANERVSVLAQWDDDNWSFKLVQSKYQSAFFLVALSTQRGEAAQQAVAEALRLDRVEAPQRALDRQRREREEEALRKEKSRLANKPVFQP